MIKILVIISITSILSGCVTGLWSTVQDEWNAVEDLVPGYEHPEDEKKSGKAKPTKLFDVEKKVDLVKLWTSNVVGSQELIGAGFKPALFDNKIKCHDGRRAE